MAGDRGDSSRCFERGSHAARYETWRASGLRSLFDEARQSGRIDVAPRNVAPTERLKFFSLGQCESDERIVSSRFTASCTAARETSLNSPAFFSTSPS